MNRARYTNLLRLDPRAWKQLVFDDYKTWVSSGFDGSSSESRTWLSMFERGVTIGPIDLELRAEPYQREAILRIIFMLEFGKRYSKDEYVGMNQLAVEMATGSGKTCVLTNIISWSKACAQVQGADFFVVLAPNTIVRQRLWEGLRSEANAFKKIGFPNPPISVVNLAEEDVVSFDNVDVVVSNIHRIYESSQKGSALRDYLDRSSKRFMVINDEAHNSVTREYDDVMKLFAQLPNCVARVDLTATPRRPDLVEIPAHFIFKYPPLSGIDGRGTFPISVSSKQVDFKPSFDSWDQEGGRQILKRPVVVRPIPEEVTFSIKGNKKTVKVKGEELCVLLSKDPEHRVKAKEIREKYGLPDSVQKSTISSDRTFKEVLLNKAIELLKECRKDCPDGKTPYKPILFAVAMNRKEADQSVEILKAKGLRTLLVIGKDSKADDKGDSVDAEEFAPRDADTGLEIPKDILRELVNKLGHPGAKVTIDDTELSCDYDAVVSVYMLKEGWDVNCVEVMALLRPFDSRLFAEQTVGRGLRIRRNLNDPTVEQNLYVVEPPNWGLDDLWTDLGAEVQGTDSFRCKKILQQIICSFGNPKEERELSKHLFKIEKTDLKSDLEGAKGNRTLLIKTILEVEAVKFSPRDVLRLLRDEAAKGKSREVEELLVNKVSDKELKEGLLSAVKSEDHLLLIETIENHLNPGRDGIPQCRSELRKLLELMELERAPGEDARDIVRRLMQDFDSGYFNQAFEPLRGTTPDFKITGIKMSTVEVVKAGRRVLEKWPVEFHSYVELNETSQDCASMLKVVEGRLHDLCSKVDQEVIAIRIPGAPGVYADLMDKFRKVPAVQFVMNEWLSAEGALEFKNLWSSCLDRFFMALSVWIERQVNGSAGEQELPLDPIKPTGRYELRPYKRTLFESEYTQFGYERQFADLIDEHGVFETTDVELKKFNGLRVLAWTTSHGIKIPLTLTRNYRPDFLIAIGSQDGKPLGHLLVEIKREDKEESEDVQLKARAAQSFCATYANVSYGILTGKEFLKRKTAA